MRQSLVLMFFVVGHALVAAGSTRGEERVIDADSIRSRRDTPVMAVDKAARTVDVDGHAELDCSTHGIEIGMADLLSAASGGVEIVCRTPEVWPVAQDAALFHLGGGHAHVTVFFRGPTLLAVYKGGEAHYAALRHSVAEWREESLHRIEFSWKAPPDSDAVRLTLRVDGQLIGTARGRRIATWPEVCYLGERGPGRSNWEGTIRQAILSDSPRPVPELAPGEWTISVDADRTIGRCYNFWSIDNFTSQDMFADPAMRRHIALWHPKMRYVNCVRLIGGRSDGKNAFFLSQDEEGEPICDFRLLHEYLAGMIEWGYTPRLVLDNVPNKLSRTGEMHTYGNTDPPKDFAVWERYVERLIRSLVDRFGEEVVRSWRMRVGTEPDLYPGHWSGTREDYLRHYDHTVAAVCRVIPEADIGPGNILNPAKQSSTPSRREQWGLDIVDHAAAGVNYATGATGTPLRHFSCSWYGRVGRSIASFDVAIRRMRERLDRYPQFASVPVEVAEFSVLTDEEGRRMRGGESSEWSGSWYAAVAERVYALDVAEVHNWGTAWQGFHYPRTHVMTMLERMEGAERLQCAARGTSHARCGAIAGRKDGKLFVLVFNHRPMRRPKVAERVTIAIKDARMRSGCAWNLSRWDVDAEHSTFIHALHADCEAAGLVADLAVPEFGCIGFMFDRYGPASRTLFSRNREKYLELSRLAQTRDGLPIRVDDGRLCLTMDLPGHSVRLIELSPSR